MSGMNFSTASAKAKTQAFTRARSSGVARAALCDNTPPFAPLAPPQPTICQQAPQPVSRVAFATRTAPALVAEVADVPNFFESNFGTGPQANADASDAQQPFVPEGANVKAPIIDTKSRAVETPNFKTPSSDKDAFKAVYNGDAEKPNAPLGKRVAYRSSGAPLPVTQVVSPLSVPNFPPKVRPSDTQDKSAEEANFYTPGDDKDAERAVYNGKEEKPDAPSVKGGLSSKPVMFRFNVPTPVAELAAAPTFPPNVQPSDKQTAAVEEANFSVPKNDRDAEKAVYNGDEEKPDAPLQAKPVALESAAPAPVAELAVADGFPFGVPPNRKQLDTIEQQQGSSNLGSSNKVPYTQEDVEKGLYNGRQDKADPIIGDSPVASPISLRIAPAPVAEVADLGDFFRGLGFGAKQEVGKVASDVQSKAVEATNFKTPSTDKDAKRAVYNGKEEKPDAPGPSRPVALRINSFAPVAEFANSDSDVPNFISSNFGTGPQANREASNAQQPIVPEAASKKLPLVDTNSRAIETPDFGGERIPANKFSVTGSESK